MAVELVTQPWSFHVGPVEVTATALTGFGVSAVLIGLAAGFRFGLGRRWPGLVTAAEWLVEHFEDVMRDMFGRDPRPFVPLVVTLALYIGTANLVGLVPGLRSPTADFSTTAALAAVVFLAVPAFGISAVGLRRYLRHYLEPNPLLLPLEVIAEFSRTIALSVRLFGNVLSEELVIAVLVALAGLLVPVPIMLLAVLTGVVQAYIFAILTAVYLSAAVRPESPEGIKP